MLVDTHCHLNFDQFDEDRNLVIAHADDAGVERIIVPATELGNCQTVLDLANYYANVFAAVGVHPVSSALWQDNWIDTLRDLAKSPKVVAIGEIGLDYYWDKSPQEIQRRAFASQLELAAELELPVIIHNRESSSDILRLLAGSSLNGRNNPGVFHSFSADWDTAESALNMGFYLGFTGPVTFKKAHELREIASRIPLDRILVETDAPFLAPEPKRGRRNEPAYVSYTAQRLADLHKLDLETFSQITTENAARLFGPSLLEPTHGQS